MNDFATTSTEPGRVAALAPDPRPVYLGAEGREVFGMLHAPAGLPHGSAVLICPPFGNSDNGSYMPRRTWAQRLAAAGRPALRIDLPGTGDSPGSPHDPGLAESWIEALSACAAWLRATYGLRTAAIGLGLGGLVACQAVERGAPIDDLVLWAVPSRGRQFLRELRIFEAMLAARVYDVGDGGSPESGEPAPPRPKTESRDDGSMESAGFVLSAETVAALGGIDLARLTPGTGAGRRALVLDRDGMEVEERLTTALASWGAQVETAPGPGFWQMMAAPYESVAPETVMGSVDDWLDRAPADPSTPGPGASVPEHAEVRMRCHGVELRERPMAIEHASGRLLAVVTEPVEGRDSRLTLVLANSGTLRRVGPNRMWTELARRWAARGLTTVRFDLSRESDLSPVVLGRFHPVHGRPGDILWDHFAADFAQQYAAVLEHLREQGLGRRFVLSGISSGGYWSLNHLREDDSVAAGVLINCSMLRWNELQSAREDAAKLRSWATWRRLLRGDIPTERVVHAGRAMARLLRRRGGPAAGPQTVDEVDLLLRRLGAADQELTFLFGSGEPLREELEAMGRMGEVAASPRVTVEYLGSTVAAHTLESISLQRDAHALLDQGIERALEASGGPLEEPLPSAPGEREPV